MSIFFFLFVKRSIWVFSKKVEKLKSEFSLILFELLFQYILLERVERGDQTKFFSVLSDNFLNFDELILSDLCNRNCANLLFLGDLKRQVKVPTATVLGPTFSEPENWRAIELWPPPSIKKEQRKGKKRENIFLLRFSSPNLSFMRFLLQLVHVIFIIFFGNFYL